MVSYMYLMLFLSSVFIVGMIVSSIISRIEKRKRFLMDRAYEDRIAAINAIGKIDFLKPDRFRYMHMLVAVSYDDHYKSYLNKINPWFLYPKELTDYLRSVGINTGT